MVPDWSRFACDYEHPESSLQAEQPQLMFSLEHYLKARELEADLDSFQQLPVVNLVDALTMALPFTQQEKQMLLESVEPEQRYANFMALIHGDTEVSDSVTRH